jgi:hypothetical protein
MKAPATIISSVSYSQVDILRAITAMHTGDIECDVTFGSGAFYTGVPLPFLCFDLSPRKSGVIPADVRHLPLKPSSIRCIAFDPPFTGGGRERDSIIKQRFACEQKGVPSLIQMYREALKELNRVLLPGGWLIFKCQDVVESGKNYFSHVHIMAQAVHFGLIPVDLFILIAKHRLPTWHMKTQRHARKFHCYFWVFQKPRGRRYR